MPDLTLLSRLFATFSAETPAVNDGLCLNRRFKAANCDLCAQACPVAAISVYGPNVQIEPETCVHCGVCLKECPTGVFSTPRQMQDDQKLLDAAAPLTARALELTCPANVHADKTAAPVEAVLQTGRCLAALSLGELLDLARPRQRNLWLNDSGCAGCPLGKAAPLIRETAAHANRLLAAWRHAVKLRTQLTEPGALVASHRVDLFSGQQPSYSRREFLTFLRRTTAQVVSAVAVDPLAPPDMTIVPPLQRGDEVPYQRRHLTAALSRLGQPSAPALDVSDLPWATVEVSAQCSACSLCARFCPTAAIRWTTQEQAASTPDAASSTTFDLSFIAADCVDCGICAATCPEAAITFSAAVDPTQLGRRVKVRLRRGQLNPCAVCQTLTDTSLRPTCYVCNKSQTKTISD